MNLTTYKQKRNFKKTPEPKPKHASSKGDLRFCVQLHAASRRHFDFRLEVDGVLKSWAVPKGPSLNPSDQRLAIMVEDHPMDYRLFEGIIPKGNYGAGTVMVWDAGTYTARATKERKAGEAALRQGLKDGHITFVLAGEKLRGEFALVKLKNAEQNAWLLVKKRDGEHSNKAAGLDDRSVLSGRTLAEIASEAPGKGEIWLSRKSRTQKDSEKKAVAEEKKAKKPPINSSTNKKILLTDEWKEKFPLRIKPRRYKMSRTKPPQKKLIYEPAWDGYRSLLAIQHGKWKLSSERLQSHFSDFAAEQQSSEADLVLDGFLVLLDANGEPRHKGDDSGGGKRAALFFVTDILHYQGYNTRELPLEKRKSFLVALLAKQFAKKKNIKTNPFVVERTTPTNEWSSSAIKGLLVRDPAGDYDDEKTFVMPIANQNQGFEQKLRQPTERKKEQAARNPLPDSSLSPVQKGKPPSQVVWSNTKKIFWPKERLTKGDLLSYYQSVAPLMLPHIIDRPQSLNRHPNGIFGDSFFQKEVTGAVPAWLATVHIYSHSGDKTINYALCQNEAALLFLANLGCIEINVWNARWQFIECPDYVVIDIDPGQIDFREVITVVESARSILERIEAHSFCKTSGGRGMHIYIPIKPKFTHDEVRAFCLKLCTLLHDQLPSTTSLERSPAKRTRLIYLDYLQNRRGQTMAAPYSARPRPEAPVSMPLRWSEISRRLNPLDYTIKTAMRRLDRLGDAWEKIYDERNDLKRLEAQIDKLEPITKNRKIP